MFMYMYMHTYIFVPPQSVKQASYGLPFQEASRLVGTTPLHSTAKQQTCLIGKVRTRQLVQSVPAQSLTGKTLGCACLVPRFLWWCRPNMIWFGAFCFHRNEVDALLALRIFAFRFALFACIFFLEAPGTVQWLSLCRNTTNAADVVNTSRWLITAAARPLH